MNHSVSRRERNVYNVTNLNEPPRALAASIIVAALSVLVLSPLRAQQFGILCLTVCVIQLLGLISFDVT